MLTWIRSILGRAKVSPISEWFRVTWTETTVNLDAAPPGRDAWSASFAWATVARVCFQAEDYMLSDGIYVFTSLRPESFVIPLEAHGGDAFWNEVVRRGLFDQRLAAEAMCAVTGTFCWPPMDDGGQQK